MAVGRLVRQVADKGQVRSCHTAGLSSFVSVYQATKSL